MLLNESTKNEIVSCLNESRLNEAVTKEPAGNQRPDGAAEWTFADWFGEDLSGQTYEGDIDCLWGDVTSLKGAPKEVIGHFNCVNNKLTSLEGAPEKVSKWFDCSLNDLTSLEGAPKEVGDRFVCSHNKLTSLEGAPEKIGGDFYCGKNVLTSIEGLPKEVGGEFKCDSSFAKLLIANADELPSYLSKYKKIASGKKGTLKVANPDDTVWFYYDSVGGDLLLLGISDGSPSEYGYSYGVNKFDYRGAGDLYSMEIGSGIFKVDPGVLDKEDYIVPAKEIPADVSMIEKGLIDYHKPYYIRLKTTRRSGSELQRYISMIENDSEGVIHGRSYDVYQ